MGRTDTEQEERVVKPRKDVQIIIHGHAEYDPNDDDSITNFDEFVNKNFNKYQKGIIELFNSNKEGLSYKSSLKKFQFDSVEKQIR